MRLCILATLLIGALCAASPAQTPPPASQNPNASPQQPQAQPAPTEAEPQAQPAPQTAPQTEPAQSSAPAAAPASQNATKHRIAPGSVIPVQLTKTIDAKKAKQGDEVVAKVTMDLKANSGEVIVPKDTKVMGHVTEAQARSKEQKESQLGIAFDRAELKGQEVNLPMSIQAVIAPPSNDNASSPGGYGQSPTPATAGTTGSSPMGSGRSGSPGSSAQSQSPSGPPNSTSSQSSDNPQPSNAQAQISGNTQGVIGMSNVTLQSGSNATQGSVLTSEKNNVKVESGTMLLLKVTQ